MYVTPPLFIQVGLSGGDRFLAANFSVFRSLIASSRDNQPEKYAVQAKVHSDASWLNPAHEDNYYIATAVLPWNGQIQATQSLLSSATSARPFDWLPPFFYAFNQYHFLADPIGGAEWMKKASLQTKDVDNQIWLNKIAAMWISRGINRNSSYQILLGMAAQTRHNSLRLDILKRADQLQNLILLDQAAQSFASTYGRRPNTVNELVESAIIKLPPKDPYNAEYILDQAGIAQVKTIKSR